MTDWSQFTAKLPRCADNLNENQLRSAYAYLNRFNLNQHGAYLLGKVEKAINFNYEANISKDHISYHEWQDNSQGIYPFLDGQGHLLAIRCDLEETKKSYEAFIQELSEKGVIFI